MPTPGPAPDLRSAPLRRRKSACRSWADAVRRSTAAASICRCRAGQPVQSLRPAGLAARHLAARSTLQSAWRFGRVATAAQSPLCSLSERSRSCAHRPTASRRRRVTASTVTAASSTAAVIMNFNDDSKASKSMPFEIEPITSAPSSALQADAAPAEQTGSTDDGGGDGVQQEVTAARRLIHRQQA